ncbi:MAG: dihydrolipoyl dehydrogenase [Firmicutes bacterium]|nr:dihydrolipoyl dehydrogenase [Bacillota bacterium]
MNRENDRENVGTGINSGNSNSSNEFDVIVIGGGPGGYVAAIRAAQLGAGAGSRVCLVEKADLGGTCLNRGCIPTKALVASASALEFVKRLGDFGVRAGDGEVSYDFGAMMDRKDRIVERLRGGVAFLLKKHKVTVIKGKARLTGARTVEVELEGQQATARPDARPVRDGETGAQAGEGTVVLGAGTIIIATGSRPVIFPGFEHDGETILTSDEVLNLREVPGTLLIVGGGVIGCEFACIFSALGTKVTIIELMSSILPTEDKDIQRLLSAAMRKRGVQVKTGIKITSIARVDGQAVATLESGETVVCDKALISVGRACNSDGIGLESAGVNVGRKGEIIVDDMMATSVPGIYAIGDVTGKTLLAHVASAQGIVAAHNIMGGRKQMNYDAVPACIFTAPEIASVGLTADKAREHGIEVAVGRFPFAASGKAVSMNEVEGFVKMVADKETDRLLGVQIVGPHATELIAEATLAVRSSITACEFAETIHAHPTLSEALMEAAEAVHGLSIHSA